jgi:hypothetical protein
MVPEGRAVNADLYCQKLYRVYAAIPCHRAVQTQLKVQEIDKVDI